MTREEALGVACGALRARSRDERINRDSRARAAEAAMLLEGLPTTFDDIVRERAEDAGRRHLAGEETDAADVLAMAVAFPEDFEVAVRPRNRRVPCPADGCPGLEVYDDQPLGCGHPTKTSGCEGKMP